MKIVIFISLFFITLSAGEKDKTISKMVLDIRKERSALKLSKKKREELKNPFYRRAEELNKVLKGKKRKKPSTITNRNKNKRKRPPKLSLEAIFDNRAKISGRWYSTGDFVKKHKVVRIEESGVILKYGNKRYRLRFTKVRDKKISFEVQ